MGSRRPAGGPTYQRVCAALDEAECEHQSGQDWQCPAHEDNRASLGVKEGGDGRVLLFCQAGCSTESVVEALRLSMADLWPAEERDHAPQYKRAAKYPYRDERGGPLFLVERRECRAFGSDPCLVHRKKFTQQGHNRPPGEGSMKGVRQVLYRLPEVLAAVEAGEPVYIAEGEKDADLLVAGEGVCGTTSPGGAGKWRDEYAEVLRGAEVVVVADRDGAGYRHARAVYQSCAGAGADASLALPKPTHEHADYTDHANAGGGIESLVPLEAEDLIWSKDEDAATPERFALIGPAELSKPPAPMEWLVKGLWPVGSYGPWGGPKKSLKTYAATIAAVAVASGQPAFGNPDWSVPKPRPVIYYGGEGGREMHMRRLQRIACDVYGIGDVGSLPLYLVTDVGPFDSDEFQRALWRNVEDVDRLHATEYPAGTGLVVLDSLYNYHPAKVEASNLYERGRLLSGLSAETVKRGIALWVLDHFNKNSTGGLDLDRLAQSGMSAWSDSWLLFEHAVSPPNVADGDFVLSVEVGSRQWGGSSWTLHIDIGPFDTDTSMYATPMKVEAERGISRPSGSGGRATGAEIARAVLDHLDANPDSTYAAGRQTVMDECGVGDRRVKAEWAKLSGQRLIVSERKKVSEGSAGTSRQVTREVWRVGDGKLSTSPGRTGVDEPASGDAGSTRARTPTRVQRARK